MRSKLELALYGIAAAAKAFIGKSEREPAAVVEKPVKKPKPQKTAKTALDKSKSVRAKKTALHVVVSRGNVEVIKSLLDSGIDINIRNSKQQTPAHIAANTGNKEVLKLLISSGADINARDKNGNTPLHFASSKGRKKIVEILLENRAEPNVKNNRDETPLHLAVLKDKTSTAQTLIASGGQY